MHMNYEVQVETEPNIFFFTFLILNFINIYKKLFNWIWNLRLSHCLNHIYIYENLTVLREVKKILFRPKKFYKIKVQIVNLIHPTIIYIFNLIKYQIWLHLELSNYFFRILKKCPKNNNKIMIGALKKYHFSKVKKIVTKLQK
jgi:hypothetical protein